jgi:hypothetical protein
MDIKKHVEVVADDEGHVLFMGVAGSGKTRAMLKAVAGHVCQSGVTVHVVDPHGDVARAVTLNLDNLPMNFLKTLVLVQKITDLPKKVGTLVIDDGSGYLSLVMNEEHFSEKPSFVFCTVQVARPSTL